MSYGCTVTATCHPEERQRHREGSSVIFTPQHKTFFSIRCQRLPPACIYCTWWHSGGDGGGRDHAPPRSGERRHPQRVRRGGGEACQLVLQGGVGQRTLLAT